MASGVVRAGAVILLALAAAGVALAQEDVRGLIGWRVPDVPQPARTLEVQVECRIRARGVGAGTSGEEVTAWSPWSPLVTQ